MSDIREYTPAGFPLPYGVIQAEARAMSAKRLVHACPYCMRDAYGDSLSQYTMAPEKWEAWFVQHTANHEIHNHGSEDGKGLACKVHQTETGHWVGECIAPRPK